MIHEVLESLKEEIKEISDFNLFDSGTGAARYKIDSKLDIVSYSYLDRYRLSVWLRQIIEGDCPHLTIDFYKKNRTEKSFIRTIDSNEGFFHYTKNNTILGILSEKFGQLQEMHMPFTEEGIFQMNTIVHVPDLEVLDSLFSTAEYMIDSSSFVGIGIGFKQIKNTDIDSINDGLKQYIKKVKGAEGTV